MSVPGAVMKHNVGCIAPKVLRIIFLKILKSVIQPEDYVMFVNKGTKL